MFSLCVESILILTAFSIRCQYILQKIKDLKLSWQLHAVKSLAIRYIDIELTSGVYRLLLSPSSGCWYGGWHVCMLVIYIHILECSILVRVWLVLYSLRFDIHSSHQHLNDRRHSIFTWLISWEDFIAQYRKLAVHETL
jgi:hypothetical protein